MPSFPRAIGQSVNPFNHAALRSILTIVVLLPIAQLWAQDCEPTADNLEGQPILEIEIDNRDIFDHSMPEENRLIHRLGNKLHINTRQETIRKQLLFDIGDSYSQRVIEETERLLRSRGYIHDVTIRTELICGKGVRITVVTTDNWTLTPSISFNRSGGETRTAVEIEESNLLGYGTELQAFAESDEDRDTAGVVYRDSNWLGDFKMLRLEYSDNSDGHRHEFSLSRPFVEQDSRSAWSIYAVDLERENPIYEEGDEIASIGEETDAAEISYGWSDGWTEGQVIRHRIGWSASGEQYFIVDDPDLELPEDRDNNYPFYQFEIQRVKYVEKVNFRVMGVTEDIELGTRFGFRIGWKDEAYDADQEGAVVGLNYNFGSFVTSKTLALVKLDLNQENNDSIDDQGRFESQGRFYHYLDENNSYLFGLGFQAARNPELFERIELGGDTGLKGYPIRFQNGDRAITLSAERRVYFNAYLWRLVKFGFAVFTEVGSAWEHGDTPVWLGDVGAGFRLVSTRQSAAKVLHIDLAFPTSETSDIDDYQFFIKAKAEF